MDKKIAGEESFLVRRGVANNSRDNKLAFVRNIPDLASREGVRIKASLGRSAVDLIRQAEALHLQKRYESLDAFGVRRTVSRLVTHNEKGMREFRTVSLGEASVYDRFGEIWIGMLIVRGQNELQAERERVFQAMSRANHVTMTSPGDELFVNVGLVEEEASDKAIGKLLDYVDSQSPEEIDLFEVDVPIFNAYGKMLPTHSRQR